MTRALPVAAVQPRLARVRLPSPDALRAAAASCALAGLVLSGFALAAAVAAEPSSFVPGRKGGFPAWLQGPLGSLDLAMSHVYVVVLLGTMWAFYFLVLALRARIQPRLAIAAIAALHLIFFLGPPLLSTDVFNYISYGRLGLLHGLNPYTHPPAALPGDPAYPFIGWRDATSVYGPLFTLGTYPTAVLGVGGALWALKTLVVGASLGCAALVWKAARLLGRDPLEAAMFYGLNPLLLVYAVGGVHNDVVMMMLAMLAIVLVLERREAAGLASLAGAVAVKASAGILLPFVLIGARDRRAAALGALAGFGAIAALWVAVFDPHALTLFWETLRWEQHHGSLHSVPKALASPAGLGPADPALRAATGLLLAGGLGAALYRARRPGAWVGAAGWGTIALLVTTAWLLPWYVIWALPLAAVSADRRLRAATLVLTAFVLAMRLPLWLG